MSISSSGSLSHKGEHMKIRNINKTGFCVFIIYIIGCLVYVMCASNMSVPVHLKVDEELYLAMAKSFHYQHNFQKAFSYVNYNCVLYSILISFAYYFFKPENIMFIVRTIGIIVMCSTVFPAYLLAEKILKNKKYALLLAIFVLFIPDMIDSMYIMQEVLCFPITIWCFYFAYRDMDYNEECINIYSILTIVFSVLAFFTKTNMIILLPSYIIYLAWKINKHKIKKIGILSVLGFTLIVLGMMAIELLNGMHSGSNHYAKQIMALFPITYKTFMAAINGIIYYAVFFLLCTGILPVFAVLKNTNKYRKIEQKFILYLSLCLILLILEIVITIFLTEEAGALYPHKFLFRYLFALGIPFIILFFSNEENDAFCKKSYISVYLIIGVYMIIYYSLLKNSGTTAIMDSHINVLIENIIRILGEYMGMIIGGLFLIFSLFWIVLLQKGKVRQKFCMISSVSALILLLFNFWQHPYYSNVIGEGKINKNDFILFGNYLGEEERKIYYLNDELDNYALFYGYIAQDYQWIKLDEINLVEREDVVVSRRGTINIPDEFKKVELNISNIEVWERK